jgi:hypothetical protein
MTPLAPSPEPPMFDARHLETMTGNKRVATQGTLWGKQWVLVPPSSRAR